MTPSAIPFWTTAEHVYPPVGVDHRGDRGLDRRPRTDVALVRGRAHARRGRLGGGEVEVQDGDGRALRDEPGGDRLPDAPGATGDHTHALGQLHDLPLTHRRRTAPAWRSV